MVRHNGVLINGKRVNVPSYQVSPDEVITTTQSGREQARIQSAMEMAQQRGIVDWVQVDPGKFEGVFKSVPERGELSPDINEHLVVELYSK